MELFNQLVAELGARRVGQKFVNDSIVEFDTVQITNLRQDGFQLGINGSLTKTGPVPATITFNDLAVWWGGGVIATIYLPPARVKAKIGNPSWVTDGQLKITNETRFTAFVRDLLHEESFQWTILSSTLCLGAVGLNLEPINLSKDIKFKAFDGLQGIELKKFKLLSRREGGITIEADADVPSQSQLAISLGSVFFRLCSGRSFIGRFWATNLSLPAQETKQIKFAGCIDRLPDDGLRAVGVLISKFLKGEDQTLKVDGDSVDPQLTWLSPALKTLSLNIVVNGEKSPVITSLGFSDVAIKIRDGLLVVSSRRTLITYRNPFGFSFQVVKASANVTLGYKGQKNAAQLALPDMPAFVERDYSEGNPGLVRIEFHEQPLKVLDQDTFQGWLKDVELPRKTILDLTGTAEVLVETPIGRVQITDLPFSCTSELKDISVVRL